MTSWINQIRSSAADRDGLAEAKKGNFRLAIENFSRANKLNPENLEAYFHRGVAHIDVQQYDQALIDLDHVIELNPEHELAYYNRSIAHAESEQLELALKDIDRAIELVPDRKNFVVRRMLHSLLKDNQQALADANSIIGTGEEVIGYVNRAIVYHDMQNYREEIADWTRVLELESDHTMAACCRGIARDLVGDREKAIIDLKNGLNGPRQISDELRIQSEEVLKRLEGSGQGKSS
jgi:tetratricopeptide (TPR) repeat protein